MKAAASLLRAAGAALAIAVAPAAAMAATVTVTLPEPGVVWVSDDSHPAAAPAIMRNTGKAFVPDLVIVTAGSSVRFPNDDAFFHSIYSAGPPDAFDIGFYDTGPGKDVRFTASGVVSVRCHIHGTMHGTIVIVDGPYAQTQQPGAKVTLTDVRPGSHQLHVWTPSAGVVTSTIHS